MGTMKERIGRVKIGNVEFPRWILICGTLYEIRKAENFSGGFFSCGEQYIEISERFDIETPYTSDTIIEILIHEILEATMVELDTRYKGTQDTFIFVMNHKELDHVARMVASTIVNLIQSGITVNEKGGDKNENTCM
jgi:hypothetical protein